MPTLSWTFPDGSASLDKVVIDGVEFEGERMEALIKDTGVQAGSVLKVYRTAMTDSDEDEGEEAAAAPGGGGGSTQE